MSTVTRFLMNRASEPRLQAPAPGEDVLEAAFQCAGRAPDHALLRPWRYLVLEGEALRELGEAFAAACPNNATEQELEKARKAPLRAPMIIVGIASPRHHPKVPEIEQILAAGSSLTLLSLAINDAGFGTMWRTGQVAYAPSVHGALGLEEHEHIVGFLYTGTVVAQKPSVPRPGNSEFVGYRQTLKS
ncbi:Nitroreductase [Marinobacter persicus]|uniref:Putative NAD(P)H nitroreductase n=1 Tax=Marinobacter persicus TaxID=930118 RepID=A0A1I3WS44_9GAMM|nr:nitroreductase [Marinobacter persicus]GHD47850.1 nitroreductase [Marinobacter persicus]SFK10474.1 Nitroreductase [Marinobacter persicus]